MKRVALALTAAVLLSAPLAAQPASGFFVKDARSLGLGGTFFSVSEGYRSLYGNPAGLATREPELTILGLSSWTYLRSGAESMDLLMSAVKGASSDRDAALKSLLADNGFGSGFHLGIGYAGKGLGLGFFITQDAYAARQVVADLNTVQAETNFQANAVIGLAFPVDLLGLNLTVGVDLRPFFQAVGSVSLEDLVAAMDSGSTAAFLGQTVVGGFGLAVDLGASLKLGAFTVGLVVRDIAPAFSVNSGTLGELLTSWSSGSDAGSLTLTPYAAVGVQYHPDLGALAQYFDPRVLVEFQDPVSVIQGNESFLNMLHAGVEIKTLSFLVLRAGVNAGYFSAGAGLDLLYLEINAAVFTEELGSSPGENGRSGIVVETAIRL